MKERRVRVLIYVIIILSGGLLYLLSSYWWHVEAIKSIGIELFAAGFTAFLLELIFQEKVLEEIISELRAPIKYLGAGRKLARYYQKSFKQAKVRIDIIALSATVFVDQNQKFFEQKIIRDKCNIRVLILDPEAPAFDERGRDEHGGDASKLQEYLGQMRQETDKTVNSLKAFYESFTKSHDRSFRTPGSLRVRKYRGIPYFGYFRVDDHCIVTPYFAFGYGVESPAFEMRDLDVFEYYAKHFEVLWERSDSASIIDIREFSILA